jgi:periplasmic protein TonB
MFDAALIESGVHQGDHRTARSLPLAIGFHAAVLGALVFSALASTADPPELTLPISFPAFRMGPPPPPKGDPIPVRVSLRRAHVDLPTPTLRIPDPVPVSTSPDPGTQNERTDLQAAVGDGGGGVPGGQPYGVDDGVPYGSGDDPGAGPLTDENVYRPGVGGVAAPVLLERIDPLYPESARKARMEGVAVLEATITASGDVDAVRVVASAGPILDAAAVSAVRRWRYRPATLNGRAVAVFLTVTVKFGLNG